MPSDPKRYESTSVLVDGRRVHFECAGAGKPLLLLHGLVGSSRNWSRNLRALAGSRRVFALDLLNMGDSDRVPGLDASLEATADRVAEIMSALGLEAADVAGHSHGGAVALALAARHPERVRSLILFAPANPFCDLGKNLIGFYSSGVGRAFARTIPMLPRWTKAIALSRMYGDPSRIPDGALEGYIAGLRVRGTVRHILAVLAAWSTDMARLRSALPLASTKPALLIWGDRDRAVGLHSGRRLQESLMQSKLVVLPGVGHIPFEEMPEPCNAAMLEFLSSQTA